MSNPGPEGTSFTAPTPDLNEGVQGNNVKMQDSGPPGPGLGTTVQYVCVIAQP